MRALMTYHVLSTAALMQELMTYFLLSTTDACIDDFLLSSADGGMVTSHAL